MGRAPGARVSEGGLNKGPWTEEEDAILAAFIKANGEGNWRTLPKRAGLQRCRKSCRLRWMNYLRPDLKRGNFTPDEDDLIIKLHSLLGNRWSMIAGRIPGRTDNEIKNYWNSRLRRKLRSADSSDVSQFLEATPLSFDSPKPEPASSTQSDQTPSITTGLASNYEPTFPSYADALPDSSIFPEYDRFHGTPSAEETLSDSSSDGTCNLEDQSCDHYYSAWTPALDEVTEDLTQSVSVKRELCAYSPESVLFGQQGNSIPDDDFSNIDFCSFMAGFSDSFGETNVNKLLLSPVQRNLVTSSWPSCYPTDGFW
ncbi:hypothetical protein KC19_9G145300 [Ceratodon purpureus]|uniref:Uncharacterized protein n=1 Tax=Ceratodon purpureus TaxID=3225 RepID=A0A8T0GXF1_CERPU|nr:hypothetical protein KC19_9G145300 [Ceratodon purpureus]